MITAFVMKGLRELPTKLYIIPVKVHIIFRFPKTRRLLLALAQKLL